MKNKPSNSLKLLLENSFKMKKKFKSEKKFKIKDFKPFKLTEKMRKKGIFI